MVGRLHGQNDTREELNHWRIESLNHFFQPRNDSIPDDSAIHFLHFLYNRSLLSPAEAHSWHSTTIFTKCGWGNSGRLRLSASRRIRPNTILPTPCRRFLPNIRRKPASNSKWCGSTSA